MLACAQFVCAQDRNYTAVNPLLFSYADSDVYVQPPQKHNNGRQIMSPDSFKYPWENHLDNGMPNALVDIHGNVAGASLCSELYFSHVVLQVWGSRPAAVERLYCNCDTLVPRLWNGRENA